ncbi:MAG: hypothetical protein L0H79_12290 [Intrasporangium sp.]|nr:hypothetical protein [Intrasporangium sp.]
MTARYVAERATAVPPDDHDPSRVELLRSADTAAAKLVVGRDVSAVDRAAMTGSQRP